MKTLLIVDDEKKLLDLYKREFEAKGYRILAAGDGISALELAKNTRPDCAIVDIRLPGMGGLALIQRLLELDASIPIIINSAYQDAKDDFSSWCARFFVLKSSDMEELRQAVESVMRA